MAGVAQGRITADGTILTTTYYPVLANQTYGNLSSVWVWNSAAQEIDIASGMFHMELCRRETS